MEDFLDFIMEAMDTSEEEFTAEFPDPFLLVEFENIESIGELDTRLAYTRGFADTITGVPVGLERIKDDKIARIKKSDDEDGPILIGRAPSNDIVLDYPRVSKHHATITSQEGSGFVITDAGSTNGTIVNERQLEKGETVDLANGDRIELGGDFVATFYTPSGLFAYINRLADEMDSKKRRGT
jgi:hypothetical protein